MIFVRSVCRAPLLVGLRGAVTGPRARTVTRSSRVCVFVYSFALEEKSWRHKHSSASPEKVALTSFSCFLLGCPKHTHTHADYASFPQRHLAACPRMTQHPSGFFFLHTLLLMFQTMTRQGGFWHVCELPLSMSFVMSEHGKRKKSSVAPRCVALASLFPVRSLRCATAWKNSRRC